MIYARVTREVNLIGPWRVGVSSEMSNFHSRWLKFRANKKFASQSFNGAFNMSFWMFCYVTTEFNHLNQFKVSFGAHLLSPLRSNVSQKSNREYFDGQMIRSGCEGFPVVGLDLLLLLRLSCCFLSENSRKYLIAQLGNERLRGRNLGFLSRDSSRFWLPNPKIVWCSRTL